LRYIWASRQVAPPWCSKYQTFGEVEISCNIGSLCWERDDFIWIWTWGSKMVRIMKRVFQETKSKWQFH